MARSVFRLLRLAFVLALLLLAVLWCLQNAQPITVSLMPFAYGLEIPLYLLILLSFAAGFGLAALLGAFRSFGLKRQLRQTRHRLNAHEATASRTQLTHELSAELTDDAEPAEPASTATVPVYSPTA